MKKRRTNRFRVFYYSHPYLVIFSILILYNIALILLFSLLLAYLKDKTINSTNYVEAIKYCAIYTMNSGDIWSDAPNEVVILKIIINTTQMITFSGALIGLASSLLQNLFNRRVHNLGKLKLKNHYVILNWSPIGANLIKELSFTDGKKTIVILSSKDRDSINEEIDNLFLESGIERRNIKIFVKQGNPSSRKALKEVSIEKCYSIALLSKVNWNEIDDLTDADIFKTLMAILSVNKNANVIIEANNNQLTKEIEDLTKATSELDTSNISIFSRNAIVGHALGRSAINPSFADLYYYLLSFEGGSFYSIDKPYDINEALKYYNNALPITRYKERNGEKLYLYSHSASIYKSLTKKEVYKDVPFKKSISQNSFTLFIIGQNDRSQSILEVCDAHNSVKDGKIKCKTYVNDVNIDLLVTEINGVKGRKKILILSDETASDEQLDNNVVLTLIKLRTCKEFDKNIEVYAEIFDPQSRFSLKSLNITGMIISNEIVALYIAQLLVNPESHHFYEDLLIKNFEGDDILIDFDVRKAREILNISDNEITFSSKLEFINSIYKASNYEYLPIGFVGLKENKNILSAITSTIDVAKNVADKLINTVTSALTLNENEADSPIDRSNILIMDSNIRKLEKINITRDTIIILVHYHNK